MKIDLELCVSQLSHAAEIYEKVSESYPSPENLHGFGVSLDDILFTLEKLSASARSIDGKSAMGAAAPVLNKNVTNHSTAMSQFLTTHQSNQQQIVAHTEQICNWLWTIELNLLQLLRSLEGGFDDGDIDDTVRARLTQADGWFQEARDLKNSIKAQSQNSDELLKNIEEIDEKINQIMESAEGASSSIEANDRSSSTAKTNAEAAASEATGNAEKVKELVEDLRSSVSQKDELFEEFNNRRAEIANLLENANKVGLAKSFQDKRKNLTKIWITWSILFVVGIAGLMAVGFLEIIPLIKASKLDLTELSVRIALVGPLIWLTWFAARQYGHTIRLSEDYAFKEAAAMAFVGYRNEVENDEELLRMLQENAIKNFGSNPSRLLLKKPEPASPIHDALDIVVDKTKLRDILAVVRDAIK